MQFGKLFLSHLMQSVEKWELECMFKKYSPVIAVPAPTPDRGQNQPEDSYLHDSVAFESAQVLYPDLHAWLDTECLLTQGQNRSAGDKRRLNYERTRLYEVWWQLWVQARCSFHQNGHPYPSRCSPAGRSCSLCLKQHLAPSERLLGSVVGQTDLAGKPLVCTFLLLSDKLP